MKKVNWKKYLFGTLKKKNIYIYIDIELVNYVGLIQLLDHLLSFVSVFAKLEDAIEIISFFFKVKTGIQHHNIWLNFRYPTLSGSPDVFELCLAFMSSSFENLSYLTYLMDLCILNGGGINAT